MRPTRFRFHQAESLTQEKNRALNLVFLRFSNYSSACPLSNLFGKVSQAVLTEMTPEEIAQTPLEELAELILKHGNNRLLTTRKLVRLVFALLNEGQIYQSGRSKR
ncbi:MAG: hypothetical protein ACUVTQ_11890 [Desulfotomaculales bacterium]